MDSFNMTVKEFKLKYIILYIKYTQLCVSYYLNRLWLCLEKQGKLNSKGSHMENLQSYFFEFLSYFCRKVCSILETNFEYKLENLLNSGSRRNQNLVTVVSWNSLGSSVEDLCLDSFKASFSKAFRFHHKKLKLGL